MQKLPDNEAVANLENWTAEKGNSVGRGVESRQWVCAREGAAGPAGAGVVWVRTKRGRARVGVREPVVSVVPIQFLRHKRIAETAGMGLYTAEGRKERGRTAREASNGGGGGSRRGKGDGRVRHVRGKSHSRKLDGPASTRESLAIKKFRTANNNKKRRSRSPPPRAEIARDVYFFRLVLSFFAREKM